MVKISKSPSWLVANAIRSPSGEKAGVRSVPGVVAVRFTTPDPSAFIVWICESRVNAICAPSGDHDGSWLLTPVVTVSACSSSPAAVIAQTSAAPPSRAVSKAMVEPPGDHAGSRSSAASLVRRTGLVPSASMTQMSRLPVVRLLHEGDLRAVGRPRRRRASLPAESVGRRVGPCRRRPSRRSPGCPSRSRGSTNAIARSRRARTRGIRSPHAFDVMARRSLPSGSAV